MAEIYQIKVTLLRTKPPIWRRLQVPATMTQARLHTVIQEAMGWEDYHLHEFEIAGERYGAPEPGGGFLGEPGPLPERSARLSKVLGGVGAKAIYTYDFGDDWRHEIRVEKVLPVLPGQAYPVCIDGSLNGPPEDSGGVFGFSEMLTAISDPTHPEHLELREWLPEGYDPQEFSVDEVNRRLSGRRAVRAR